MRRPAPLPTRRPLARVVPLVVAGVSGALLVACGGGAAADLGGSGLIGGPTAPGGSTGSGPTTGAPALPGPAAPDSIRALFFRPAAADVRVADTLPVALVARLADGTERPVPYADARWDGATTPVARTVPGAAGVLGWAVGAVEMAAEYRGLRARLPVTVAPARPRGLVNPANWCARPGMTSAVQFRFLIVHYVRADSAVFETPERPTWASSDTLVARVAWDGTVDAGRLGTARVTATGAGVQGTADVRVAESCG